MQSAKEIVRSYVEAYDTGDPARVLAFLHPEHTYHPPSGGRPMDLQERADNEAPYFFAAFSDIKAVVEDQVTEGDKVASRISMYCTHTGSYLGLEPTNRRIVITYLDMARLEDGKIIEEWAEFDVAAILDKLRF
jgi:predicted ester cyclase